MIVMKPIYTEERPWGKFEQFTHNDKSTVKLLHVKPHSKLSLQYHNKREESWRVISGSGKVVIGDKILDAKEGDEFFIPFKEKHRIITEDSSLIILEIAYGEFDEKDIVRLEDDYNRK